LIPAFKPHEIMALPKRYFETLKAYYFMVYPPKEHSDLDEVGAFGGGQVIDFDKMSAHQRALMRNEWGKPAVKGDST
jgi:hypothetical protein